MILARFLRPGLRKTEVFFARAHRFITTRDSEAPLAGAGVRNEKRAKEDAGKGEVRERERKGERRIREKKKRKKKKSRNRPSRE